MNSMAFSLLANSSPEVNENQKMELTIGSLSFYVGPLGSTCLLDPVKSGSSTNKTEIIAKLGSSVGSSSEANSPVSPAATENLQETLEESDETWGEPDVEVEMDKLYDSSRDFTSRSSGVSRSITKAAEEKKITQTTRRSTCKSTN
jgi:hypothetical protein